MISLKTAAALLTALVVAGAALAAVVFAVQRSHDSVPEKVRACAEGQGAVSVKTAEALGAARPDVLAGREPPRRTWRVGQDRAVLMQGADYAVLVLRSPTNPPLPSGLLRAVYRDPSVWALVAVERAPVHGVLAGCAT
ncbi:MAG TPA: hypothetical protein VKB54_12565 [Solirubrobacteraceae bacterium]|nr:hypothetical protein [Solirubrobacteraceae bacterium]